jgi:hypothetical protein
LIQLDPWLINLFFCTQNPRRELARHPFAVGKIHLDMADE